MDEDKGLAGPATPEKGLAKESWRRRALGLFVSGVLVLLLVYTVPMAEVFERIKHIPPSMIVGLLLLHGLVLQLRVHRWTIIVGAGGPISRQHRKASRDAVFVGWLADSVLPLKGGDFMRPLLYARKTGTSFTGALAAVVFERALDLLALATLLGIALGMCPEAGRPPWSSAVAALAVVAGIIGCLAYFMLRRWEPGREEGVGPGLSRGRAKVRELALQLRAASALLHHPPAVARVLGGTALIWILEVVAVALTLAACGLDSLWAFSPTGLAASGSQVVASTLAVTLPRGPTGVGTDQWASILALEPFGVSAATATAVSIVDVGCVLAWVIPFGILASLRTKTPHSQK